MEQKHVVSMMPCLRYESDTCGFALTLFVFVVVVAFVSVMI